MSDGETKKASRHNPVQGPLSGVRILDLSRVLAGPWAVQQLGDLGAEIIKVERPRFGDDARRLGPPFVTKEDGSPGDAAFFLCANRNKRSITIDISKPEGQNLVKQLAAKSDVLIENYKVGDLKRYGLDYESLAKEFPRLIYCSVTGFGHSGPYKEQPGYDPIFQAMGGLMSVTGHPDGQPGAGPMKVGPSIADLLAALYTSTGISAALYDQARTNKGRWIDISLLDSVMATLTHVAQAFLVTGIVPPRRGAEGNGAMPAGLYKCADGKQIIIAVGNETQWLKLCDAMALQHLAKDSLYVSNDKRVENRASLAKIMDEAFVKQPIKYWLDALVGVGVPAGPVNDMREIFEDPHTLARNMLVDVPHPDAPDLTMLANPIKFSDVGPVTPLPPPILGEHTDEILFEELGLAPSEVEALRRQNII